MINFPRLTMRNINRLGLALALFAPIAYLFGTQFAALGGAHGEKVLADGASVDVPSGYVKYHDALVPVLASDFTLGFFGESAESLSIVTLGPDNLYSIGTDSNTTPFIDGLVRNDDIAQYLELHSKGGFLTITDYTLESTKSYALSFYLTTPDDPSSISYLEWFLTYDSSQGAPFVTEHWLMYDGSWSQFSLSVHPVSDYELDLSGQDAFFSTRFPVGSFNVPVPDDLKMFKSPAVEQVSYSDMLFGNMFNRDNFLVQWGRNSVSENPVGFAPVGTLFKYLDDNMLHFAVNDTQWGLMAYGYLYWSAHVLLFDLVFYCGTFFITLFKNIVDKLGGVSE